MCSWFLLMSDVHLFCRVLYSFSYFLDCFLLSFTFLVFGSCVHVSCSCSVIVCVLPGLVLCSCFLFCVAHSRVFHCRLFLLLVSVFVSCSLSAFFRVLSVFFSSCGDCIISSFSRSLGVFYGVFTVLVFFFSLTTFLLRSPLVGALARGEGGHGFLYCSGKYCVHILLFSEKMLIFAPWE